MIAWQNPAAFAGLVALAIPVVLHLLRRRQAVPLVFASVRFLDPSLTGAVRLRPPADLLLLAIRVGILGLAVCAVAQPIVLTPGRIAAWNARTIRAVVVDMSESMRPHQSAATQAAEGEARSAYQALRIDAADLRAGLRRASGGVLQALPGRREIVVISDFAAGSLDAAALDGIPSGVGLRFVPVGASDARSSRFAGLALLAANGGIQYQSITIDGERTRVLITPGSERLRGLQLHTTNPADAASLLEVVAASGAPAPDANQPIVMAFASAQFAAKPSRVASGWMLDAVLRMRGDDELARAAGQGHAGSGVREAEAPWVPVTRSEGGAVLVRAAAIDRALAVDVSAEADSYLAAAALRAALWARSGDVARQFAEREVLRIPRQRLAEWSRPPGPISRDGWPRSTGNDARWFWAAVLALIGVETLIRRRKPAHATEEARAA